LTNKIHTHAGFDAGHHRWAGTVIVTLPYAFQNLITGMCPTIVDAEAVPAPTIAAPATTITAARTASHRLALVPRFCMLVPC